MQLEIHADCPVCRVEGAVTETLDTETACGRLGIAESTCCRLCGRRCEGRVGEAGEAALEESTAARTFATPAELEAALQAWAREEGLSSARELLESAFVLGTVEAVHAALARGEAIETTFDVADLLFGSGASGGGGEPLAIVEDERPPSTLRLPPPPSIRRYGGARDELLALASVAAADGEANAADLGALARAAQARGVELLPLADVHVRRPGEVDPPATLQDRERVLEEMFQMAWADGELDESELRVIRDYARAWGIDPERLAEWLRMYTFADTGPIERWFRRVGQMIFPER